MIRPCGTADFRAIHAIINAAAQAYRGVIPDDCWHEPYMSADELRHEIESGVSFSGYEQAGALVGVMGSQPVRDVLLIRHAYVQPDWQRRGVGAALLAELCHDATEPVLIGTWAAATWAIRFYERHGFRPVSIEEKDDLLGRYWTVAERQMATSVVLADQRWFDRRGG